MSDFETKHSNWRKMKLGDIAEVIGGGTPKTSVLEYWNGNIPWITPRDLTGYNKIYIERGGRNITKKGLSNSSARLMPKGTVLLTSRAPIGYLAIANNELSTNQGFKSLVVNEVHANNLFVYYWLKSNVEYLKSIGSGSTFAEISGNVVKEILVFLPPLPEQKAIAEVLSSLDDKLDLLHCQNKTLEEMAQALFRKWFIEEKDEDWKVAKLGEVLDFNPTYKLSKRNTSPYLKMGNINSNAYAPLTWYDRIFSSGMKFMNGDTLLARITPCLENGKTCFVDFLNENEVGWGSTEYIVMRSKKTLHPFLSYVIARHCDFRDFAISSMTGSSGRQRAEAKVLKEYEIAIPPKEFLVRINEHFEIITLKLRNNSKQIHTLENLRNLLLPRLMSGMIRVNF